MFEAFQNIPMSKEHGQTMPNHLSGVSGFLDFLDHTSGSEVQSRDHDGSRTFCTEVMLPTAAKHGNIPASHLPERPGP